MDILQHVSNMRSLIKQVQDDSHYTDQFLYSLLTTAASRLQYQRNEKYKKISDFNWITFCIRLEKAKSHDCDCVPVGCTVLKSVVELPKTRTTRSMDLIRVRTLGDEIIPRKTPEEVKADEEDEIKAGSRGWYIRNNKLIIWNELNLKAIQVEGVWDNIVDWTGQELCDKDTGDVIGACQDVDSYNLGLDSDLYITAYQMVLQLLGITLRLTSDMTVDSQPEIKA